MRLSRLADDHEIEEFRDAGSAAHREMVELLKRLVRPAGAKT
jgi:hypothetical protein